MYKKLFYLKDFNLSCFIFVLATILVLTEAQYGAYFIALH